MRLTHDDRLRHLAATGLLPAPKTLSGREGVSRTRPLPRQAARLSRAAGAMRAFVRFTGAVSNLRRS